MLSIGWLQVGLQPVALHLSICLANSQKEEGSLAGSYTGEALCSQEGWLGRLCPLLSMQQ